MKRIIRAYSGIFYSQHRGATSKPVFSRALFLLCHMRIRLLTVAYIAFAGALILLTSLIGCGGGSSGTSTPPAPTITSVTASCSPTSIQSGQTSKCTATVSGTGDFSHAVIWSVDNGTIDQDGNYTAPSSATTASVKATSTQDATKSGAAAVTVIAQVSVSVTPTSAQVQVFHSQQFAATVKGSSNTAVTWAVNGTPGGNLTVGQIDSTGFYLAPNMLPSPAGITVTATSQADTTQGASASVTILPDAAPPSIVSVTPPADQTGVPLDSTIQIQFSDSLDPSTVNSSTFALSSASNPITSSVSYDPSTSTVTMTAAGIFAPGTQYTVAVSNLVADPAGTPLAAPSQWSFTTQTVSSANGVVSDPSVPDPTTLTVVSYGGQENTPDSQGNFTASITPFGTNLVAAMVPGKSFGWLAFAGDLSQGTNAAAVRRVRQSLTSQILIAGRPPIHITRYQITGSPRAAASPDTITIDSWTTAEGLLFMTPYFYNADPTIAAIIQAAIANDPNTATLAQALETAQSETDPINDVNVQATLQAAALSILQTLVNDMTGAGNTSSHISLQKSHPQRATKGKAYSTNAGSSLEVLITPNCWAGAPGNLNSLQCLDLQYLQLNGPLNTDSSGNYDITVNNCSFAQNNPLNLGCSTNWLVEVASLTNLPAGGINSIIPAVGSGGQSASPIADFDPGCTLAAPSDSCQFIWVPGSSAFEDAGTDISSLIETAIGLQQHASAPSGPNSFTIPGGTQQNYIVRAYSGGFADLTEYANILNGDYNTDSLPLVANALAMNAIHVGLHFAGGLFPDKDPGATQELLQCVVNDAVNNHDIFNEVSAVQSALRGTSGSSTLALQQIFEVTANDFVDLTLKYEASCATSMALDGVKGFFSGLTNEVHRFLNDPNSALASSLDAVIQAAAAEVSATTTDLGEGTQGAIELIHSATPLETAIISVAPPSQANPQITGISPNPVIGLDGKQPITIQGYGFESRATINWDIIGGTSGTATSTSVTATAINADMNFTSQPATWKIQVVNGDGTLSNWFQFAVISSGSNLPAPTLSAPANGATGVSTTPTFSWSAVTGNDGYRILVATSASGLPTDPSSDSCSTCVINQTTSGTSYTPSSALGGGTVYYWEVHALTPPSNPGYGTWSSIFSFTTANKFYIGEYVIVSGTGGIGLNLHSCADTSCNVLVDMPDGTVMQVIGGPSVANGHTWWNLSGTVAGVSYTGWAIQDYLIADPD